MKSWIWVRGLMTLVAVAVLTAASARASAAVPPVAALSYSPDGKTLAASVGRDVLILDVASGDLIERLPGKHAKSGPLAYAKDGRWLAVADGTPGMLGQVRLFQLDKTPLASGASLLPAHVLAAHKDLIQDLVFSPDGKTLATCSYDRLIKLWDVASGKEVRTLRDHSDTVYGIAFHPQGTWLASVSADRAVKVWDVATGKRLYTLSEATDWLYAVAWSPDGKRLAAAGVDKSIRVWQVSGDEGQIVQSVFAHEGPVTRLAFAADGKTLYSLGEDSTVKAWDTARMVERKVYAKQPETVLALAVRPDTKQLALGRYDGSAVLLDEASGNQLSQILPVKPKPPVITKLYPSAGKRGVPFRMKFEGKHLLGTTSAVCNHPGVNVKIVSAGTVIEADVTFPATTPPGIYQMSVQTPAGQSGSLPFMLDAFDAVQEQSQSDSPRTGQVIPVPCTVVGSLDRAGDVDFYRIDAKGGQELGVQVVASSGSKLEPVLSLTDLDGHVLVESTTGLLGHRFDVGGRFALSIRDRDYRGEAGFGYRLQVGDLPIITSVFPLGVQRGKQATVQVEGVNLGANSRVLIQVAPDKVVGSKVPVAIATPQGPPLGTKMLVVGEFPEVFPSNGTEEGGSAIRGRIQTPGTANGLLVAAGDSDTWSFQARKGERLILEVEARRVGSPLDSYIEILDSQGKPLQRATLRSLARTYVTFRDHDAVGANIRLEAWSELAINDYILVGNELLRIKAMPTHPDADAVFFSAGGQRTGHLDTTTAHLPLGTPMYKVEVHPPGISFPPNGFPQFTLYYRNDDAGPGYGKDSRLFFDPPADGEYLVRIGDSREVGLTRGADLSAKRSAYPYRLTVRPPRPSFTVSFSPTSPAIWKGGAIPISVTVDRQDGFDGAIELKMEHLPPGLAGPSTTIAAGENSTAFALFAEPQTVIPAGASPLKLVATAHVDGQEIRREVTGGPPQVVEPGDLATVTQQAEVALNPGGEGKLTVRIERRNGFTGRVPLEVRGLPHGVKVKDIGLNGILITEKETERTVVIYAEPWVKPQDHPIVVLARREGKNTEHAAKSVLLRIAAK